MFIKTMLLLGALMFAANSISAFGKNQVLPAAPSFVSGADGFFKCGGDYGEKIYTKATALRCIVTDRTKCDSLFNKSDCEVVRTLSYPAYAQFRAEREKQKVQYLGLAPVYVGTSSELRVFVFVKIIPQ